MYRKLPDAALLAAQGLRAEDYASDMPALWPENVRTVEVFSMLGTQWATGMNGATGLRYEAIPVVLRLAGIPRADHPDLFAGLRIMERAALEEMRA